MNTLPDDIFNTIMRLNSHPCADMMNDFFQPYREAMDLQQKSLDPEFMNMQSPGFFEWKVHGIGCEQWALHFTKRANVVTTIDILDALDDHVNGDGRIFRMIIRWAEERGRLKDLEYHH